MGEISVKFEALEAGATGIRNNYTRLTGTIEQLETDLQPMIASWSGAAQESYLACKRQWDEAATALSQVLNSIGSAVNDAHQNYTAAESAAQANWS
ncbi:WXG100 family type VII secretion target [uncultured Jatrophihabitans sp.]|uniref:WXG100 family type VII secretion target n=1 Tax=uncultured Jatrophihabitans sp. TaxID=1610747 RepID=UPI0035C9F329